MKTFLASAAAIFATGLMGSWVGTLDGTIHPKRGSQEARHHEDQAGVSLLGQFRTTVNSWLWLRTDLYLHNGVEMRKLTDAEIRAGVHGAHNEDRDDDALCEDGVMQTVVPPAERDFRGMFGEIERGTSAYQDMGQHEHNDPKSALPLFRLMTWLDPQFVPAWVLGSSILKRDRNSHATAEAERFLRQGLYENPGSISMQTALAELLITRKKDLEGAKRYLREAIRLGYQSRGKLDEDESESLNDAFRWLALCERDLGRIEEENRIAQAGLKIFPDDIALQRLAVDDGFPTVPSILSERYAKELKEKARTEPYPSGRSRGLSMPDH